MRLYWPLDSPLTKVDLSLTKDSMTKSFFLEIGRVWRLKGKRPTESAFNSSGKYSVKPYKKRWGSFGSAVDLYLAQYGEPNTRDHRNSDSSSPDEAKFVSPPESKVIIPPIHKPSKTSRRDRILYGEPMDFRGLRYAPINEQGVVYLFGMVSRELGFLIESVRTEFPDCEGKRATNKTGTHWEHVRIEFEYKSKNFFEHGHDPDGCDLIVCWLHDWKDCPLEVLELRSVIPLLPKGR